MGTSAVLLLVWMETICRMQILNISRRFTVDNRVSYESLAPQFSVNQVIYKNHQLRQIKYSFIERFWY